MASKKCKGCGDRYDKQPDHPPFRNWCSTDCALSIARDAQERARAKQQAKAKRVHRDKEQAFKRETRQRKEAVKPLAKLLSETQTVVNRYVRLRDKDLGCVSCDKPASWHGQWHASHFHARGKSSKLRFNLWNIHKSCSVCNAHLSGNLREYEPELIKRIGIDRFDWMIKHATQPTKYDPDYLRRMKRIFARKCKLSEKEL